MRPAHGAALLLIVTACVYAPTLGYGYVYEDLNDPQRFFQAPRGVIGTIQDGLAFPVRVLTGLSFDLSKRLSGSPVEPWGFHAVSVALHLLNSLLLYLLARRVVAPWAAVGALALFALHPLQVEAVAYISSRADLVMTCAILCGLLAVESRRWALACGCAICAVLGKESGVVAFPLLAVWAVWRGLAPMRVLVYGGIGLAVSAAVMLTLIYHPLSIDLVYTGTELAKVYAFLARIPVPVAFAIDHDWSWVTPHIAAYALWGTAALAGLVALFPSRLWALAAMWVGLSLAPRLLVPLVEGLHEHHMYASLIGVSLLVGSIVTLGASHGISETSAQA